MHTTASLRPSRGRKPAVLAVITLIAGSMSTLVASAAPAVVTRTPAPSPPCVAAASAVSVKFDIGIQDPPASTMVVKDSLNNVVGGSVSVSGKTITWTAGAPNSPLPNGTYTVKTHGESNNGTGGTDDTYSFCVDTPSGPDPTVKIHRASDHFVRPHVNISACDGIPSCPIHFHGTSGAAASTMSLSISDGSSTVSCNGSGVSPTIAAAPALTKCPTSGPTDWATELSTGSDDGALEMGALSDGPLTISVTAAASPPRTTTIVVLKDLVKPVISDLAVTETSADAGGDLHSNSTTATVTFNTSEPGDGKVSLSGCTGFADVICGAPLDKEPTGTIGPFEEDFSASSPVSVAFDLSDAKLDAEQFVEAKVHMFRDAAKNVAAVKRLVFKLDLKDPAVPDMLVEHCSTDDDVLVSSASTPPHEDGNTISLSVDGSAAGSDVVGPPDNLTGEWAITTQITDDELHLFEVTQTDPAGNTSGVASDFERADHTNPTVIGSVPADGSTVPPSPATVKVLYDQPIKPGFGSFTLTDASAIVISGSWVISANMAIFTPDSPLAEADGYVITASDAKDFCPGKQAGIFTATFDIDNAAPVAVDDAYATNHDTTLVVGAPGVLGNDSDGDGDTLSASLSSGPAHGTVSLSGDGSFAYSPDAGYVGSDSFSYTASDGLDVSSPATVSISVVNTAPVAGPDAYATDENTVLAVGAPGVLANDSDAEGDSISASVASGPSHGTLSLGSAGGFTYTPDADYHGPDSFTYSASDGLASSLGTVSITVTEVPDPPDLPPSIEILTPSSGEIQVGSADGASGVAGDAEGPVTVSLSYSCTIGSATATPAVGAGGGWADHAGGMLGSCTLTATATDSIGQTATDSVAFLRLTPL